MGYKLNTSVSKEQLYPKCPRCKTTMHAVWFIEKETEVVKGTLIYTGRVRDNISHFECDCGNVQPIDDTFAGLWSR